MGIVDEDVVRVRESTDFVAIATQFMQLKRVGTRWVGLCPFHGEKSPSFSVNAELGLYYCFGCGVKGDVIKFVREIEHLDFVGSVEYLASKAGITLRYTDNDQSESRREKNRLTAVMGEAVEWYHQRLLTAPDAGPARRYLRDRGLEGDLVRQYKIGWAPDDWDALSKAMKSSEKALRDCGLAFMNKRNRLQDFFRGRVLFPIFDPQGDPVSFGGRIMPGGEGPKYRNTSETRLYSKSKVLYGLNWAKDSVARADEVIVCEGYTDVIGFAAAGVPRAVATCGTALTEEHVRLLKRFARRVVIAFDPDAAGQAAADRFYEWERKYEVDVAVADLPPGQDPGDLFRSDPERLRAAVEHATPYLGFRVERVLSAADLSSPEGRARAAEGALAVIAEHPSEFVRDQYLMEVADRARIAPDRLRASLGAGGRPKVSVPAAPVRRDSGRDTTETEALRVAIRRPDEMMPLLDEVLFNDDLHLSAFRALADAKGDLHQALANADPEAAELLQRCAVEDTEADPHNVRTLLLREKALAGLREVEADARQDGDPLAWAPLIGWLKPRIEKLEPDETSGSEAQTELLGWLIERSEGKR